jgi:homoserine O-acetyltransferase
VDSDRLYPLSQQRELADALGVPLRVITSMYGHDGFLIESDQVSKLVEETLAGPPELKYSRTDD